MTDQRMALLTRLEQATGSTELDVVREALHWAIEELMEADVTERLGAGPHERTPDRLGQRNGHRPRLFDSRAGALELGIPKLRSGSYFPDWLLEPRRRAERALVAVIQEAYVRVELFERIRHDSRGGRGLMVLRDRAGGTRFGQPGLRRRHRTKDPSGGGWVGLRLPAV